MSKARARKAQKERHVSIRVSEKEAAQLERVAAVNKLGVATWVRRTALLAADREDPEARKRRVDAALRALSGPPMTAEQARRMWEASRRSE